MHYKFHKVYIEITNICGLECTFCPTKDIKTQTIDLHLFDKILKEIKPFTNDIAFHVFGDPLILSNLKDYLDLALEHKLNVHITTTGYYLKNFDLNVFLHKSIKQINFSLNSFNKNEMQISLDNYLEPIFKLCDLKLKQKVHSFINFRLWNLDDKEEDSNKEDLFNQDIFRKLSNKFKVDLSNISYLQSKRLDNQILINFDNYFEWPNLNSQNNTDGYCHGLKSQIAILSSGIVVPCCLDSFGIINLGNIKESSLNSILNSKRAIEITNGFNKNKAVEELCQKCTFKHKFDLK